MRSHFGRALLTSLALIVASSPGIGAEPTQPVRPPLSDASHTSFSPALNALATRDHIAITGLERGSAPRPGDSVTVWIGTREGERLQQYLLQLRRGTLTPQEAKEHTRKPLTKYVSWGPVFTFQSEVEAIDIWLAGPVDAGTTDPQSVAVKRFRVFVPADLLRLGLDDLGRFEILLYSKVREITKEDPKFKAAHLYAREKSMKPQEITVAKEVADKIGITDQMARAWVGGSVALHAFYDVVQEVNPLRDLAEIAVERPSLLKLAKVATGASPVVTSIGGPESKRVQTVSITPLRLEAEGFDLPYVFRIEKEPIVAGRLVAAAPTPPLDLSAGIITLLAIHPKDRQRIVQLAVVAAKTGEPANSAAASPPGETKATSNQP